jgi:hypothetical protein
MKTIFIVLLLAALGAGAYFYFSQKQKLSTDPKELIAGKWKIDSVNLSHTRDSSLALAFVASDSNLHKYQFEIDKGLIIQTLDGKTEDTSHYEFTNERHLLVWSKTDTVKTKWTIDKLDSLQMVVRDKDSTVFSFKKI